MLGEQGIGYDEFIFSLLEFALSRTRRQHPISSPVVVPDHRLGKPDPGTHDGHGARLRLHARAPRARDAGPLDDQPQAGMAGYQDAAKRLKIGGIALVPISSSRGARRDQGGWRGRAERLNRRTVNKEKYPWPPQCHSRKNEPL
jgi:hypothetical protein